MHPFGVAQHDVLREVESTSWWISDSLSMYANTENIHGVDLFRLGLQMIASASRTVLQALDQVSSSSHYTLDQCLSTWLSSSGPNQCLVVLGRTTHISSAIPGFPPADKRLRETIDFFQEHRDQFDFLLTSVIRDREALIHRSSGVHSIGAGTTHMMDDGETNAGHPQDVSGIDMSISLSGGKWPDSSPLSGAARPALLAGTNPVTKQDSQKLEVSAVHPQEPSGIVRNVSNATERTTRAEHQPSSNAALLMGTNPVTKQDLQKLEDVLSWLNGLNCDKKHEYTSSLRQPDTCTWFPTTHAYKEWRSGEKPFLWLSGKAGAGKSVLAASTIEDIRNTLEDGETLVFFYCDFADQRSATAAEVMRSLLSQLLRHLRDRGVVPGDLLKTILEEKRSGSLSLTDTIRLCGFVTSATKHLVPRPLIVIDALDECIDLELLLRCLVAWNKDGMQLLVTSRPLQIIKDFLGNLPTLSLEDSAKALASDINLHVTQSIDSSRFLGRLDSAVKKSIYAVLNRKADGMFKWVQCQISTLEECRTLRDVWETLNSLPTGLEDTYERILRAVDERPFGATLARRALVWLVLSLEPLRFCQLAEALSIDVEQQKIDREARPMHLPALLDALSSLVIYNEQRDVITLSHFSVKEYLIGAVTRSKLPYHVKQQDGNIWIARVCMCYISLYLSQPQRTTAAQPELEAWPMLGYVFSFGFEHLAHINGGSIPLLRALTNLQSAILQHPLEWDRLCELREDELRWPYLGPTWPSSQHDFVLYVLIAYASKRLLQTLLPFLLKQLRSKPRNRAVTNPLIYATDLHQTDHAMILLTQLGSSHVHLRGLALDDSQEVFPLEIAVERNNHVLVDKFLSTGCSVPTLLFERSTCMPWCSSRVLARLLQTSQFMEWAVSNIKDEKLYRGMFSSGRPGTGDMAETEADHVVIARRLLQVGCDISVNTSLGVELLERSTYAGHVSVLEYLLPPSSLPPPHLFLAAAISDTIRKTSLFRFLICQGVDIRAVSPSGDTGLHLVMSSLWEERTLEATKLLVEVGCDPFARNQRGETPLHRAVKHGHVSVVKCLLSLNTAPDPLPSDILLAGLESASTAPMLRFLIDQGVDVRAVTSCGDTALHLAMGSYSERDCLETVRILVKARCDPRARNQMGETLIHATIRTGYISVMEYLLTLDVPLPPNVLRFAVRQPSSVQMIRLLIAKGADVHNVAEDNGETALLLVMGSESYSEEERLEVVKILVEAEASLGDTSTLILAASDLGYTSVLVYLLEQGVPLPNDILLDALEQGHHLQMIRFLVENGADLHATTLHGDTAIDLAVIYVEPEEDCLSLVKFLIDAGARVGDSTTLVEATIRLVEATIRLGYTSLMAYLLSQNIPLGPPNILLTSLQLRASPATICFLAENGADLHVVTNDGRTVLQLAMRYQERDCLEIVKLLIDTGASVGDGTTLLEDAIHSEYPSLVKYLLSRNAPLRSSILLTSLQEQSRPSKIYLLVENGADLDTVTDDGRTVLQLAMRYQERDCLEIVDFLVNSGASLEDTMLVEDAIHYHGYSSLVKYLLSQNAPLPSSILLTSLQEQSHPSIIRLLVENGTDLHTVTDDGRTVLQLAMQYQERDCLEIVKFLVNSSASVGDSTMLLEDAIRSGYFSLVKYLLSRDSPLRSSILLTSLQEQSHPSKIHLLVENGADLHTITDDGRTVLQLAMRYQEKDCLEIVKCLVDAGASLGDRLSTMLVDAIRYGYPSLVKYLLSRNVPLRSGILLTSLQEQSPSHPSKIRLLVENGADLHTVLQLAMRYQERDCLEIAKCLVDAGASLVDSTTLVEDAIRYGYPSALVKYLLSRNAPLPSSILLTSLQEQSHPSIIRLLVENGVDVLAVADDGRTVLHLALQYGEEYCLEIVKILINAGCDPRACNSYGGTFVRSAMDRGYISVVDYVLSLRIPLPSDILLIALERCSSLQIISSLVDQGADVNVVSASGESALHLAMQLYSEPDFAEISEIFGSAGNGSRPAKRRRLELESEMEDP